MHIRYGSPFQAKRALQHNGQVVTLGGVAVMIGVSPCQGAAGDAWKSSAEGETAAIPGSFRADRRRSYSQALAPGPRRETNACAKLMMWIADW
jgi:MPPN (rrm-like) domain.